MRRYPVMNLGQGKVFETLTDQQIISACKAVNVFNDWQDWQDTPTGANAQRDAIAALQSIVNQAPRGLTRGAIEEIREYCPNSDAILDHIQQPYLTETNTAPFTSYPPVATTDRFHPPPTPPPNNNPPVASVDRYIPPEPPPKPTYEPVASVDRYIPPDVTEPVTTGFTGSEPEPEPTPTPTPTPTPMQPFVPPRPMVPTGGQGCWYTPGQGYSWGARPSGSETTGLNQSDCENLMRMQTDIRGQAMNLQAQTAPVQATQYTQETQAVSQATAAPNMQPAIQTPPNVQSTMCPPGQFWDGRQCRGSVAPGFGNLMNAAGLGPSGGAAGGITAPFGGEGGFSSGGAPGAFSMAMGRRRYPVVNL